MNFQSKDHEEIAVLGACLRNNDSWLEVQDYLNENEFGSESHRLIWRSMCELAKEEKPINEASVSNKLKEHRCLTRVGGISYIYNLTVDPDVANTRYYADEVKKGSLQRQLEFIGEELQAAGERPRETLANVLEKLLSLSDQSVIGIPEQISDPLDALVYEILNENGSDNNGLLTGFTDLDKSLWGMFPGELVMLCARPSVGKTALGMQIAANITKQGHRVLFFSLEMPKKDLLRRLVSSETGVPYRKLLKSQYISEANREAILKARERIKNLPLIIDDRSRQRTFDVRMKARREKARNGLDLIIVDYVQLLAEKIDDFQSNSDVSVELKAIAKDLGIPVLGLGQLSRPVKGEEHKRPKLSDIRSTGQYEQDADTVMFMWYPNMRNKALIEVFIEKHRNGPVGSANLKFDNETTRFSTTGGW